MLLTLQNGLQLKGVFIPADLLDRSGASQPAAAEAACIVFMGSPFLEPNQAGHVTRTPACWKCQATHRWFGV